jgi:hypothetical protein
VRVARCHPLRNHRRGRAAELEREVESDHASCSKRNRKQSATADGRR